MVSSLNFHQIVFKLLPTGYFQHAFVNTVSVLKAYINYHARLPQQEMKIAHGLTWIFTQHSHQLILFPTVIVIRWRWVENLFCCWNIVLKWKWHEFAWRSFQRKVKNLRRGKGTILLYNIWSKQNLIIWNVEYLKWVRNIH